MVVSMTKFSKKGKDGNKGRLNGNFSLSAMIILFIIDVFLLCIRFLPGFNETMTTKITNVFGSLSGKSVGKLLAIPLFSIIYLLISRTIGSKENFRKRVEGYMQYPGEIRKKANAKLLVPFFILLAIIFWQAIF